MIKLKITKVINIVKLSRNSLISWIICNLFYNLTVLHTPCWLQKFHYYFWKFDGFLDMPKLLVFSFIKYTFALFCFSSNNRSEFSKHLLYSSLIDWFVAGQSFSSYLRVSILHSKNLLSTTFDNNLAREVSHSFFFGKDVITVTGIPKSYGMYFKKYSFITWLILYLLIFSILFLKINFIREELAFTWKNWMMNDIWLA